jgi:hypothetical protein
MIFLIGLFAFGFLSVTGSYGWSRADANYQTLSVDQFTQMMDQKDFVLKGEIERTDLLIPFNKIDGYRNQLPEDKDSRIVVYCMMGPMGSMAAKKLAGMGYTRVFNLQGGMMAWEKIGKSLLIRTQ